MAYLRNTWYVAGHAEEIAEKPLGRTYLDEQVVIYRGEDGVVVALDDRCPHRFADLHKGRIVGNNIECPYHGLQFNGAGACASVPSGGEAPPRAKLKTYPIVERHSMLWIWMGEAALANPDLIPDFSDRDDGSADWFTGVLHAKGGYQLLVDNLLDLSHSEFLHPLLSSPGWASRNQSTVTQNGNQIIMTNIAENDTIIPVMAITKPSLGKVGKMVHHIRWDPPSLLRLSVDYFSGDDCLLIPSAHLLTPETEFSTHYFIRGGQTVDASNKQITAGMAAATVALFRDEDVPVIESQQRYLGSDDLMDRQPAILKLDAGAIRVRRQLAKLIREEQAASARAEAAE